MIPLIKTCLIFLIFFIFMNSAKAATYLLGNEQKNISTLTNNSVTFNNISSQLIIDTDKTLSEILASSDSTATFGVGNIRFNSANKTLTINDSIGSSDKIIKNIIFDEDATLEIKNDIYAENIINNKNVSAVTLVFSGVGTVQNISAKVGSADNRIKNINISNLGFTGTKFGADVFVENLTTSGIVSIAFGQTMDINGNLQASGIGKIKGFATGVGGLTLSGTEKQIVNATIGQSATIKLGTLTINNSSDEGAIFNNDIFTSKINVNGKTTIAGTADLGIVNVAANKELIFTAGNITMTSLENSGTVTIPSGKIINITKDTAISGTLNIGVDYNLSNASVAGQINALGDVDIADDLKINFNFSKTDQKADSNLYTIITVAKNLTVADISQIAVSDNSLLMNVSLKLSTDHKQILAYNGIDKSTLDLLDESNSAVVRNIMNIDSTSGNIKSVQNQLSKISDLETLKKSLKTLRLPINNMTSSTASSLNNRSDNIIISHIFSPDSGKNSGFSSGNKNINQGGIWGQAFEGKIYQKPKEQQEGYNSNTSGVIFGSDKTINYNDIDYLFGLATIYAKADVDNDLGNKSSIDSFGLALYNHNISESGAGFYNNNIFNLAYNKYKQIRDIAVGNFKAQAKAKFDGLQYGFGSGFGYNLKINRSLISPNITIKYSRLNQSDYEEQGAGDVGLKVKNQPFENLSSTLATKFSYNHILDKNFTAIPVLNLGWTRNLKTDGQQSTSSFIAGGDEINNKGVSLAQNIFNIGFEMNLVNNKNNSNLTFSYNIEGGSGFESKMTYLKYRRSF